MDALNLGSPDELDIRGNKYPTGSQDVTKCHSRRQSSFLGYWSVKQRTYMSGNLPDKQAFPSGILYMPAFTLYPLIPPSYSFM